MASESSAAIARLPPIELSPTKLAAPPPPPVTLPRIVVLMRFNSPLFVRPAWKSSVLLMALIWPPALLVTAAVNVRSSLTASIVPPALFSTAASTVPLPLSSLRLSRMPGPVTVDPPGNNSIWPLLT